MSVAVSREHRRAKTDRLDTELLKRGFLGWLRDDEQRSSPPAQRSNRSSAAAGHWLQPRLVSVVRTRRWRETDSNFRSPRGGDRQSARERGSAPNDKSGGIRLPIAQ
jgi:hypothetical protein